jgi:hypothetical protein
MDKKQSRSVHATTQLSVAVFAIVNCNKLCLREGVGGRCQRVLSWSMPIVMSNPCQGRLLETWSVLPALCQIKAYHERTEKAVLVVCSSHQYSFK